MAATLTVRLSDDEHRMLRAYAQQRGYSQNEALRRMIGESTRGSATDGLTPGMFDSGDALLGRRIDDELAAAQEIAGTTQVEDFHASDVRQPPT